mgnify:FL=1
MASTYGKNIRITLFGQSHGPVIGVTIEGLPAGMSIDEDALHAFMARRAPGGRLSTGRREGDTVEFLSGLYQGHTCGSPLTAVIRNTDARPQDYAENRLVPRPGHADYTGHVKYGGFEDPTGGGHFSGRLTAPLCVAGALCIQLLREEGIEIAAHIAAVEQVRDSLFAPEAVNANDFTALRQRDFPVLNEEQGGKMRAAIERARADGDSVGGVIECAAAGLPAGLGDPMMDGMENRIASVVFAIPGVKGLEFGSGFAGSALRGSQNNDAFCVQNDKVRTRTNHHGGILGGITSGMPLVFRAAVKPTPSIARGQGSVDLQTMQSASVSTHGRHDPCIVPRAVPCVEAAAAIAIYDALLEQKKYR